MDWLINNWVSILAVALLGLSLLTGLKWQQAKHVLKDAALALTTLSLALEDNKLTAEERAQISTRFADVLTAVRELIGKG